MTVAVIAIAFDHGRGTPFPYTLPLRQDLYRTIEVPEWRAGQTSPSIAAYVRDKLPPVAAVLARFAAAPGEARRLEIRAQASVAATAGPHTTRLLPHLAPTVVIFNASGDSGCCVLPMGSTDLAANGVDSAICQWNWQFRRNSAESWQDFDATIHKIYVVLSESTAPWIVRPANPALQSLPWADALEVACQWAKGAQDPADAAARVTKAVNDLGNGILRYDALVGAPHYTVLGAPHFLCDAFLDRLRGGEGAGPLVNCSDCATIVSTMANLLGADLWQSKMGLVARGFSLNPIMSIGSQTWTTLWGGFAFHEVAWSDGCTEQDTIFDACLHADADADPTSAPHTASLPMNQVFGAPGTGQYRDQLAAPADRVLCAPQPALRVRRTLSAQELVFSPNNVVPIAPRGRAAAGVQDLIEVEYFLDGFKFFGIELPGWSLSGQSFHSAAFRPNGFVAGLTLESQLTEKTTVITSWWRSGDSQKRRLRIESIETPSATAASEMLLRVVSDIQCPLLDWWEDNSIGDEAMKTPAGELVVFRRGNHVHATRTVASESPEVIREAAALDRWLTRAGTTTPTRTMHGRAYVAQLDPHARAWRRLVIHRGRARRSGGALFLAAHRGHEALVTESIITAATMAANLY